VGDDEQGSIQGSLTSLQSVAGAVAPPLITFIFGYFISDRAPANIPGAPFFFSSALIVVATLLAARSFRRNPVEPEA
ncbi:MAG TPA: tetracycline resistance MFS efflux pump, partial [Bacteroidia bacterium]|nr:tetracycline resistance MFS efflux pump [Bacteroidia bacterium]